MRDYASGSQICLKSAVSKALSAPSVSRSVDPGGVAIGHIESSAFFRMAIGSGEVALHDQARPVFHQGMANEAEYGPAPDDFL